MTNTMENTMEMTVDTIEINERTLADRLEKGLTQHRWECGKYGCDVCAALAAWRERRGK